MTLIGLPYFTLWDQLLAHSQGGIFYAKPIGKRRVEAYHVGRKASRDKRRTKRWVSILLGYPQRIKRKQLSQG